MPHQTLSVGLPLEFEIAWPTHKVAIVLRSSLAHVQKGMGCSGPPQIWNLKTLNMCFLCPDSCSQVTFKFQTPILRSRLFWGMLQYQLFYYMFGGLAFHRGWWVTFVCGPQFCMSGCWNLPGHQALQVDNVSWDVGFQCHRMYGNLSPQQNMFL